MKRLIFCLMVIALSSNVSAYSLEKSKKYQAQELAECTAFYLLGAEVAKQSDANELVVLFVQSATMAVRLSQFLSTKEEQQARVIAAIADQKAMINNDYSDISLLTKKYGYICKIIIENPVARQEYWIQKSKS